MDDKKRAVKASDATELIRASRPSRILGQVVDQHKDWKEFVHHRIFLSSLAISFLYLTVLSFDGTMLAYLISHAYSDSFLAGMRGVLVVAGLLGTLAMPLLEKWIGLVRAGSWSVVSEFVTLIPALLSFYVGTAPIGQKPAQWNAALLFTGRRIPEEVHIYLSNLVLSAKGMALSRIGLWSFDLCQLKCLQLALNDHPRRNALSARQFAMQDIADLMKYILTIILSSPAQFQWAALVSFIAVGGGVVSYAFYVYAERGHYLHLGPWGKKSH